MSFILASLYSNYVKKMVFEERRSKHPSKGPHELVVCLNNDSRVINEIRRLKQTSWNKKEEDNCVLGQEDNPEYFYELKEGPAPSTTGFLDTILKEIEARSDQLDLGGFNIIWASSKGMHYRATFIEDAASYYSIRLYKKSIAQPQIVHLMPKNLSTLG